MANPEIKTLNEWEWTKVATNVTTGSMHRIRSTVYYYQTYRLTGEAAPSDPTVGEMPDEAVRIFEESNQISISSTDPIDVYILCANSDDDNSDAGKVRVDL